MQSLYQYQRFRQEAQELLEGQQDLESKFGYGPPRAQIPSDSDPSTKFIRVDWESPTDPLNPANFSTTKRICTTLLVGLMAFVTQAGSSVDASVAPQAAEALGVSSLAESLSAALYLIGMGVGCLFCGPLSETFGRNPVYIGSLVLFLAWELGATLSPNFGAQIAFRFLAGILASPTLTVAGGTSADLWNPLEKTWGFPLYSITGISGAFFGPVMSSWVGDTGSSWRWADGLIVISTAVALVLVVLLQNETFGPILLKWKAIHLRELTGDDRYQAPIEQIPGFWARLAVSMRRSFEIAFREIIVLAFTLYLTIVYIVIFAFLSGFEYIYQETYGFSQTLSNACFAAMAIGVLSCWALVPYVYAITKKRRHSSTERSIQPEMRLWYAMIGAPAMPVSLFWMAWSNTASISPWSTIISSVFFGSGITCIFLSAYMYMIDSYGIYAASALTFVSVIRYLAAGGMTIVSGPFYQKMGTHFTLTILAGISAVMVPVPYLLYFKGPSIRKRSRYAP